MGHLTEKTAGEGSFASAVGTDQAVNRAGGDFEADVVEDFDAPEREPDVVESECRVLAWLNRCPRRS